MVIWYATHYKGPIREETCWCHFVGYLTDRIVHTMVFITPVLAGMRNSYITELKVTDPKTYHTMNGRKEGGKCFI